MNRSIFLKKLLVSFKKIGNLKIISWFVVLSLEIFPKVGVIKNILLLIFIVETESIFLKFL